MVNLNPSLHLRALVDCTTFVCRKVVSTFSFNWKKKRDLAKAQTELKLHPKKLITESAT